MNAYSDRVPADASRMFFANTLSVRPLGATPGLVDTLSKAIFECEVLTVEYANFEGNSHVAQIEPWSLLFSGSGVYLYAKCVDSERDAHIGRERVYNLARLKKARGTRSHFAYPHRSEFDPEAKFKHCFGIFLPDSPDVEPAEIRLRFCERWRSYLEIHKLHEQQKSPVFLDDGCVEVTLHLHLTYDLVRWIRGHGTAVEVLEPQSLLEWVSSGTGSTFLREAGAVQ